MASDEEEHRRRARGLNGALCVRLLRLLRAWCVVLSNHHRAVECMDAVGPAPYPHVIIVVF
eukprot:scaffold278485_cov33-Tisochrysis_lutea.AAC.3